MATVATLFSCENGHLGSGMDTLQVAVTGDKAILYRVTTYLQRLGYVTAYTSYDNYMPILRTIVIINPTKKHEVERRGTHPCLAVFDVRGVHCTTIKGHNVLRNKNDNHETPPVILCHNYF